METLELTELIVGKSSHHTFLSMVFPWVFPPKPKTNQLWEALGICLACHLCNFLTGSVDDSRFQIYPPYRIQSNITATNQNGKDQMYFWFFKRNATQNLGTLCMIF